MTEYQSDQNAAFASSALKSSLKTMARARRCAVLVGVADRKNEGAWLDAVEGCLRRELEGKVKRAKKAAAEVKSGHGSLLPAQIHIHQCPDCEKATVQTSRGELVIRTAELEQAQCDCQTSEPGRRNTTAIPPAMRRNKIARANGGTNDEANLTTLCSACHRLLHEKGHSWVGEGCGVYQCQW